ncbi:MAG TPA: guanylate kinase, partial [Corynebacterium sp.]|nr:guanylate kinase [Corynebacterium sp.]
MPGENPAGRLVVLAGPSAVGKSTVVHRLRSDVDRLYFSVSMTTRAPRPGEVDGVDYFFVSPDQFQENIDNGMMLEWADIHGGIQRSGTPAAPVREALAQDRPVLVEVDLEGARNVKKMMPEAQSIFL